ncbi:M20 family metallopeptidase [Micropruina sp.]|uniref:M20 metallopeptidase family protein n=1 Tax=Micropruina sp. TaxID=2737536 RepID=UPI002639C5D2|nr:M20 family metallopeptidase [Micropruina sp.]
MTSAWPDSRTRSLVRQFIAGIDEVLPQAKSLRRAIHSDPYIGGSEQPTADLLRSALTRPTTPVADTGFWTRLGPDGPSVALRSELDALPLTEDTGVDWASTNGAMHACGHDIHMAAVWSVIKAAEKMDLPAGLLGIYQPREECQPSGAPDVLRSGLLAAHDVRSVVGAHVQPRVPEGLVSTGIGGVNAAADAFDIIVRGHGGHGAYPHVTIDPVPVLASIASGLYELVGRLIDPTHAALISIGRIEAGATHNIIPDSAKLQGIIRTMHEADRRVLHAEIRRFAEHTAAARGTTAEVTLLRGDPVLANDHDLVKTLDPVLHAAGLQVAADPFRSLGADDFSHFGQHVPIVMMFVGTGEDSGTRHDTGLHHARYLPDEDTIRTVAIALASGYLAGARLAGAL